MTNEPETRVAILHGAGYTGGELVRLVLSHPKLSLVSVTSRSGAGNPLWHAHAPLRGVTDTQFIHPSEFDPATCDAVFVAAEHGQGAVAVKALRDSGFDGYVVDLSADFRLSDPATYERRYGREHPAPELAPDFRYGLSDVFGPYEAGVKSIANPGCFATGLSLALWPFAGSGGSVRASVTAMTGASGSGVKPSAGTHFPRRDGNVRAYKVLDHQHLPEVLQVLGQTGGVDFTPVSGPWTRGIWGTAYVHDTDTSAVAGLFEKAYADRPLVRLWPDVLPELRYAVGTPFCDLGWVVKGDVVVVGFALDNLLKGAASQAIQNLNHLLGYPDETGLLP